MSESKLDDTLEEKVQEINQKAERAERADDLEAEIQRATRNIRDLGSEIRRLDNQLESLGFYNNILTQVFGGEEVDEFTQAFNRSREIEEISEGEVIEAAENRETNQYSLNVSDTMKIVQHAKEQTIEDIRDYQREWEQDIESARDLNQIIGGAGEDFRAVLDDMSVFLNNDIWDEDQSISALSTQWDELTSEWEENAGKHGWDAFQEQHDLAEETMEVLRQFASHRGVQLDQVDMKVVEDMKSVPDLESAIRMEIET